MLYFEFNRTGGKEKYIPMTKEAFQQALTQEERYFIRYERENYVLKSTEQEFRKFHKNKNHSEYIQFTSQNLMRQDILHSIRCVCLPDSKRTSEKTCVIQQSSTSFVWQ